MVSPYDPNQSFFGCCGELPPEGIPAITKIPVASFEAQRAVSAMSRGDHWVHLEGVSPSGWQMTPCERASGKGEGRSLSCQGLTFLPLYETAPLFNLEESVGMFSKELFPVLSGQEPPYKEALNWLHFSFTDNTKGPYVAPANTAFSFASPVEGGAMFLRSSRASKPSTPVPTPGALHLSQRVQRILTMLIWMLS